MKKKDLLEIYQTLNSIQKIEGVKFAYAVAKNKKLILPEFESIQEAQKVEKYIEYETKANQLKMEYCDKDKAGNPKIENNRIFFEDLTKKKGEEYRSKWSELEKEYAEAIKEFQEKQKEVEKILEEETKLELHKIKIDDIPDNMAKYVDSLFNIID